MNAGPLKHRFEFQLERYAEDYVEADDAGGTANDCQLTKFRTRGSLTPNSTSEPITDDQAETLTSHTIKIRYDRRLKPHMQAKLGDRVFSIEGFINEDEANEWLIISANELTG